MMMMMMMMMKGFSRLSEFIELFSSPPMNTLWQEYILAGERV